MTTTAACTGPGAAQCGGVQVINASLIVINSPNSTVGPGSNLNLTIRNTGNLVSVALTITLSRVQVLNATFLWAPGNVMTCSVYIPSSQLAVTSGSAYQLEADVFYGTNNLPNHITGDALDIVNATAT
jgi:hypothetical protein